MRGILAGALLVLGLLATGTASAQHPLPPPLVPTPHGMVPAQYFYPPDPSLYRPSRYQVWQYYDVTSMGQFRPLVIYGPHDTYYYYNGAPFPWPYTRLGVEFRPLYGMDSPAGP
jgi:hypothetical protein